MQGRRLALVGGCPKCHAEQISEYIRFFCPKLHKNINTHDMFFHLSLVSLFSPFILVYYVHCARKRNK